MRWEVGALTGAQGLVTVAPDPSDLGVEICASLNITSFPKTVVVCANDEENPNYDNAEVIQVVSRVGASYIIRRQRHNSRVREIEVGDRFLVCSVEDVDVISENDPPVGGGSADIYELFFGLAELATPLGAPYNDSWIRRPRVRNVQIIDQVVTPIKLFPADSDLWQVQASLYGLRADVGYVEVRAGAALLGAPGDDFILVQYNFKVPEPTTLASGDAFNMPRDEPSVIGGGEGRLTVDNNGNIHLDEGDNAAVWGVVTVSGYIGSGEEL